MLTHSIKLTVALCISLFAWQAQAITLTTKNVSDKSIITLKGVIGSKDYPLFNRALKAVLRDNAKKKVIIVLNSGGGNFPVALKMAARINRLNKQGGNIETSSFYCHSACFFIAVSGRVKNVLYSDNLFAVHFPYYSNGKELTKANIRQLFNQQVQSFQNSGLTKQQSISLVKKGQQGTPTSLMRFSRKELIDLGFKLF